MTHQLALRCLFHLHYRQWRRTSIIHNIITHVQRDTHFDFSLHMCVCLVCVCVYKRASWVMFNRQHGQSCCTACLSQCCMFTKHLSEVNLVKGDCTTQCVLCMCMFCLWRCLLHHCLVEKFSKKLGDSERLANVFDRQWAIWGGIGRVPAPC